VYFKNIVFEPIDACNLRDFPRLELEVIRKELTFRNYQLKNALSYLINIEILVSKECISDRNKHILQAKMQSRHINSVLYSVLIAYTPNINDISSIIAWKCTCKVGNRKVGCCSHVATLIFYLSIGVYENDMKKPGNTLNDILLKFGIRNEDEHIEGCCCGGEGIFKKKKR
jgi:hypothetical protein